MKAQIPRKTSSAKTGSNRRNAKAQLEKERLAIEARAKPYRKARGAFVRERKVVLTREAIKAARPILEKARRKFALASLRLNGDVDAILKSRKAARRAIDRALLAAIPGYRHYEAARNTYLQTRGTLFAKESAVRPHDGIVADIGDAVISADVDYQVHRPPFAVHDVSTIDAVELLTLNESFADPQNGILFNNIKFSHNEDNWGGYNPTRVVHQSVSVGINFEVPATGFLRVGAVMRNLFNHFAYSVSDNFGFSHADLIVEHEIAIDIVRSGELEATNYFFSLGDLENVLELTYNHDGRTYDLGTGYGHIAIGVDDLDATLAALKDGHGIEPERPPYQVSEGGSRICFVRDPDGYRVELIERRG